MKASFAALSAVLLSVSTSVFAADSGASMLTPAFAGELFGAGQPLDASKYYIIIPDAIGHGKSSKPSDGMKTASRNTITTTWSRRSIAS